MVECMMTRRAEDVESPIAFARACRIAFDELTWELTAERNSSMTALVPDS